MAVIPDVPGIKVEILVNGATLKEYVDEDEEDVPPRTVIKYIEAISGAEFKVKWWFAPGSSFQDNDMTTSIYLDGKYIQGALDHHPFGEYHSNSRSGHTYPKGNQWFKQSFRFSQLTIDEGNARINENELKAKLENIGEIRVSLRRGKILSEIPFHEGNHVDLQAIGTVPEKALKGKALSHQATLGIPQETSRGKTQDVNYIDPRDAPFASFSFRYRSLRALKALHIVPRTPAPVPLEERPIESLTAEEMRELLKRQKERDAIAKEIKQEGKRKRNGPMPGAPDQGDLDGEDDLVVLEQRPSKTARSAINRAAEIIDLTIDD